MGGSGVAVIAVVVVGVTAIALALTRTSAPPRLVPDLQLSLLPRILCLMVTGKDDDRVNRLAPRSVRNFLQQTYPNARLVVLNHHPRTAVVPAAVSRVTEFRLSLLSGCSSDREKSRGALGEQQYNLSCLSCGMEKANKYTL